MDLKSHIGKYLRKDRFEIPFKNRTDEILKMVDTCLMNVDCAIRNQEDLSFSDIVCVDFYGSGKTRLGNEFVNEVKKIKLEDFKSKFKSTFNDDFSEEEFGRISKARTIRIEMNQHYTPPNPNSSCFYVDLFKQRMNIIKEKEIWELGFRKNDDPLSIFLFLDEFQIEGGHLNSAIKDLRTFRGFLVQKSREFVENGNRLYIYMCGRSNVLAEIGTGTGSPTKVVFITLEALKCEHVKEIISEMPEKEIIPKTVYGNIDLLNHFVGQLVEECGVVPRILEIIFLILDYYVQESKLPDPKTEEELDCFLHDKIFDVLVDVSQIPDSIFRLDVNPGASFGVFSSEVGFLLHLYRFEVNVLGRMKEEFEGTTGLIRLEKLIGLSFFSLTKKNENVHHVYLPNIYRRRLMDISKKKFSLRNNQPLDENIYIRHYFLLGLGNLLEYVVARSIIRQNQTEGSMKHWNDLYPSLGDNNEAVFGNSFVYSTKVVDIPKITKSGKSVESFSSLEDIETYRTLKPECFRSILSVLEKEKGIVILLPGEQSGSCDLYLYYCDVKMLVGIACKDYSDGTKFTETIFNEELDKFLPDGLLKKECHEVRTFVLIVCCTNVDYLKEEWVTSTFHNGNDGIYGVEFDVEGGGKKQNFEVYTLLLDEMGLKKFLTDEDLQSVIELREKKKHSRAFDFVKETLTRRERKVEESETKKMVDEESETKVFNLFSYIENPNGGLSEITFKFNTWEGLVNHLFEKLGRGNENEVYKIYDEKWKHLTEVDQVMIRPEMSTLYFVTKKEKQLKEKEEARKLKEKEEARKLQNDQGKPIKVRIFFVSDEKKLDYVDIDLFEDDEEIILKKNYESSKDYVFEYESYKLQSGRADKNDLNFYFYIFVEREISGTWDGDVVGKDMRTDGDYRRKNMENEFSSHYLLGKFCFLLSKDEKEDVNKLYRQGSNSKEKGEQKGGIDISRLKSFRAGSGMCFLDKWFDDEEEEDGKGAFSGRRMKDEDSAAWKKEILLECSDGGIIRKNMDDLLEKSRFFRMMMNFNGKEAQEAREHGKIKIEFLTTLEMEYYLNIIFGMIEEDKGGNIEETGENCWIRLLLRMLEFGMRYQERKVAKKVLTELEMHIIPDLISCGTLDLKFLELGHLFYDRLPNGLLEELLERWCLDFDVRKTSTELRRLIQYSSIVMEKACTFLEEEETDMLDEDDKRYDYGVGEVVLGNGKVLDQCFVGEFGGQVMIWNDSNHENNDSGISTSFISCLNGSTKRSLFKIKRKREVEDNKSLGCVGDGKARKRMTLYEVESFLLE